MEEVGKKPSVTGERIRQIQVRALRKLRYTIHFVKPITHFEEWGFHRSAY
ncbi:MAG: sigma factor-like helix-turn-helix DNA-binding protein [Nitrospirota bacterium]|nr:sigma factor-like helix-turn-helix DNA-binding protein [Nitrospirota bacterium]